MQSAQEMLNVLDDLVQQSDLEAPMRSNDNDRDLDDDNGRRWGHVIP